jgi:hypothetical protein
MFLTTSPCTDWYTAYTEPFITSSAFLCCYGFVTGNTDLFKRFPANNITTLRTEFGFHINHFMLASWFKSFLLRNVAQSELYMVHLVSQELFGMKFLTATPRRCGLRNLTTLSSRIIFLVHLFEFFILPSPYFKEELIFLGSQCFYCTKAHNFCLKLFLKISNH